MMIPSETHLNGGDGRDVASSRDLRILAVIANESISGPGRQLAALAEALRGKGVDFRVAILHRSGNPSPPYAEYLDQFDIPHEAIDDRGPFDVFGVASRIRSGWTDWMPDIVQTHGYKATAAGWLLRKRVGMPWVGFFHGETHESIKARFYHRLDHAMLRHADRIVVMSRPQHRRFERLGARALIIHNAVLPGTASPPQDDAAAIARAAAGLPHPILGVVGRLSPEKGVDIFLDACALLQEDGREFSALIAGDGPDRSALEARCRGLGLEQKVRFLGVVRNVEALYRMIDVLVIPSRSEGLPNVLLEALRADIPAIATHVGAVPDVLVDPAAGIVVPAGRPEALAAAVGPAMALRDSREGHAARTATVAAFSIDQRVRAHLNLYHALIDSSQPRDH